MSIVRVTLFRWDVKKNAKLLEERGICFEDVLLQIEAGDILEVIPGKGKYSHQKQFIVAVNGYAHVIPYVENQEEIFLKTIIPSRAMTKKYLRGE